MPKRTIIKKILPLVLLAALAAPGLIFAQAADTQIKDGSSCGTFDFGCHMLKAFNFVTIQVGYGISYVGGLLISLASTIIQIIISAGNDVLSSQLVRTGFRVALDITNLGFVLAIIMIAFTTMFRLQGYETKQFLKNLIVAAVLVNFSMLIAGVIVDASNVFGNFFLNAASPGDVGKFADNLAGALNVQKILGVSPNPADSAVGTITKVGSGYFTTLASLAAVVIFNTFLVITFYAIAIMLLLRYLWITFLIIVMPLAWLAYAFPTLSKHFSEWWKNFLHWNIFYPLVALFLYLGVQSSQAMGQIINNASVGTAINGAATLSGLAGSAITGFMQIFVQVAIMLGGLYTASRLKIYGADAAMKMAVGVKDRVLGVAKTATGVPAAGRYAGGVAGGAAAKAGAAALSSKALSWIPGAKTAAANLYNVVEQRKNMAKELQKSEFDKDSDDAILVKARQTNIDVARRAALANEIVKRGLTENPGLNREDFESRYLGAARELGTTKDILEKRPDFAPKVMNLKKAYPTLAEVEATTKAIEDAMQKFKPSNTENLPVSALKNATVVANLREAHLSRMAKEGTEAQKIALVETSRQLPPDSLVAKYLRSNPAIQSAFEGAQAAALARAKTAATAATAAPAPATPEKKT